MFDKTLRNSYTNRIFAIGMTTALVFAYAPTAIADPISNFVPNTTNTSSEVLQSAEDEDPASANRFFEPTTLTERIILEHANDLGVDAFLLKDQLFALADMTRHIESDNKRAATNAYSGAMSYYQFLPNSVVTAVNRLEIVMKEHGMGRVPAWASRVHKNPQEIYSLSNAQQRLLMLVNIMEQKSSDDYLQQLGSGNNYIAKELYYRYHHTAPDPATKSRTNQLFPDYFPNTI